MLIAILSAVCSCAWAQIGVRKPTHAKIPSDHMNKIACVTCHVREATVTAVLAVGEILKNGRFDRISPAYVKGNKVYELREGRLAPSPATEASPLNWTFSHNVSRARKAWGANGCADCHAENSEFFNSPVVVDPYDAGGKQVMMPMRQYAGLDQSVIRAK